LSSFTIIVSLRSDTRGNRCTSSEFVKIILGAGKVYHNYSTNHSAIFHHRRQESDIQRARRLLTTALGAQHGLKCKSLALTQSDLLTRSSRSILQADIRTVATFTSYQGCIPTPIDRKGLHRSLRCHRRWKKEHSPQNTMTTVIGIKETLLLQLPKFSLNIYKYDRSSLPLVIPLQDSHGTIDIWSCLS